MSCNPIIMQGDSYFIEFDININDEDIDLSKVESIQFVVGELVKYYYTNTKGEVTYDSTNKVFDFPISQSESFSFDGPQDCQVRIKFTDDVIIGQQIGYINLQFSSTKEPL